MKAGQANMAGKNGNSCCGSSNRIDSFEKTQQELSLLQDSLGISIPSICLPSQGKSALEKWAVIACDQYTSEPEYWEKVNEITRGCPSTYHMIYPEAFLGEGEPAASERIKSIKSTMHRYLQEEILEILKPGLIYTERSFGSPSHPNGPPAENSLTRKGLMLAFDLEKYDFSSGSQSLIRATEGTVTDRLPPRVRIRKDAELELPHILILIDDPGNTVIKKAEEAAAASDKNARSNPGAGVRKIYDFDLMLGGGRIKGWHIADRAIHVSVLRSLSELADPENFSEKYGIVVAETSDYPNTIDNKVNFSGEAKTDRADHRSNNFNGSGKNSSKIKGKGVLLFAVGDGNHSLATAKVCWEDIKKKLTPSEAAVHPARFALAELVNIHDEGILFEPIHRILYNAEADAVLDDAQRFYEKMGIRIKIRDFGSHIDSYENLSREIMGSKKNVQAELRRSAAKAEHIFGLVSSGRYYALAVKNPVHNIETGTLQCFLDEYLRHHTEASIDYVHGNASVKKIGGLKGNTGFFLPVPSKDSLFKTVIHEGILPRKSFSMGEARDKRYYLECRRILP